MVSKRKIYFVAVFFAILFFAQLFLSLWVRHEIQHRMKMKIDGAFTPVPFLSTFYLRNASFEWNHKAKLVSGDLKVRYDLAPLLTQKMLRVKLSSRKVRARLLDEWARMQGVEEVALETFDADLGLDAQGIREIYSVEALSPTFQFRIKKSEV